MTALVYGIINENLVLLPENVALAIAADLEVIWQLTTFGEARHCRTSLVGVPGLDDDDYDEVPDDTAPYTAALTNECLEESWPHRRQLLPSITFLPTSMTSGSKLSTSPGSQS